MRLRLNAKYYAVHVKHSRIGESVYGWYLYERRENHTKKGMKPHNLNNPNIQIAAIEMIACWSLVQLCIAQL